MKKILPAISVLILIVMIIFTSNTSKTYAGRGCCSWHGGQAYCGSNGKWICQDGTESPSCTCSTSNYNNELDDNLGFDPTSSCSCYTYISTINDLEKEKKELIEEKKRLENDKDNLFMLLMIVVIIFIIYIYVKRKEN